MSRVTVGAAKPAALFCDNESAVKSMRLCRPELQRSCLTRGKISGNPIYRFAAFISV